VLVAASAERERQAGVTLDRTVSEIRSLGHHVVTSDAPADAAAQDLDQRFPGFAHDIHGVERDKDGAFRIECLTGPQAAG
jgi:hypothetical protein